MQAEQSVKDEGNDDVKLQPQPEGALKLFIRGDGVFEIGNRFCEMESLYQFRVARRQEPCGKTGSERMNQIVGIG